MPPENLLPERLAAVLAVVYLIFNEGYGGRGELAGEAIRLGTVLAELMPEQPEAQSLLALMPAPRRRSGARFRDGELVLLEDQDRELWDRGRIATGRAQLKRAAALHADGPYFLQARIAACHLEAERDWPQIAELYAELARRTGSPVVELNRAVAIAETDGPAAGLAAIDGLELEAYPHLHATRADFLRRLGRDREARAAYERALELSNSDPDRRFLAGRLAEVR